MNMNNIEDHKLVKEAMAEKLYKIQNDKYGWEIYFLPLSNYKNQNHLDKIEVISYYKGEPFLNPRRFDKDMSKTKSTDNVEVMTIEEARECWELWVEHQGFEVAEVEDYLRGGRSEWAGENFNYRKESKTASWSVPEE
jgi:hypothetical protein